MSIILLVLVHNKMIQEIDANSMAYYKVITCNALCVLLLSSVEMNKPCVCRSIALGFGDFCVG